MARTLLVEALDVDPAGVPAVAAISDPDVIARLGLRMRRRVTPAKLAIQRMVSIDA